MPNTSAAMAAITKNVIERASLMDLELLWPGLGWLVDKSSDKVEDTGSVEVSFPGEDVKVCEELDDSIFGLAVDDPVAEVSDSDGDT